MSGVLLVVAVLIAAAACPAMMWLRARRGGPASCFATEKPGTLDELRRRRAELDAAISRSDSASAPDAA